MFFFMVLVHRDKKNLLQSGASSGEEEALRTELGAIDPLSRQVPCSVSAFQDPGRGAPKRF